MGEVNNVMCDYLGRTGCFADFWNGTVFSGMQIVEQLQLNRHDREYYKSTNKEQKVADIRRDVQMYRKGKNDIILGVELLDTQDYTIPVRICDYNMQELIRQIKDFKEKNRREEEIESGVFLYGLKRTDRLVPVYTIGLYCGDGEYDGVSNILAMLNMEDLEPEYQELLEDYRVKIYNLKDLKEENYQTSWREIIAVFKRSKDKEAMKTYYLEHKECFRQLDDDSINVLGVLIGKRTLKLFPQEEGGLDVCKAFEDEREEGREEGLVEGKINALIELVKDGLLKLEEAAKRLNMTPEELARRI